MLFITTRGKTDVYTAARTLQMDKGTDGGFFVPFRMPILQRQEVVELAKNKPSQNIADFLNMVFGTKLTDWDVELSLGRNGFQLTELGHKLVIGELWHNRSGRFSVSIRELARQVHPEGDIIGNPTEWVCMAIRIAVVFGMFTELLRKGLTSPDEPLNVAVCSGDFSQVMAVWYARKMGLPIGDIIIGCNENSAAWDLINRGELNTYATPKKTSTPDADYTVPTCMERLIHGACGHTEAMKLCWSIAEKESYVPEPTQWEQLRSGLFAAVISQVRLGIVIPSVFRSHQYIMDLYTALSYGALSDYRSRTGDGAMTLLISESSPLTDAQTVSQIMHISSEELKSRVR